MSILIGHAVSDERGKIAGGQAGDQTGKEVATRNWYSTTWHTVLRAKDATVAEKIAKAMQAACDNNNIGYDQNQRTTLFTAAQKVGFDLAKITTKCETDCSALVAVCVNGAGIAVSKDIYTGNMVNAIKATGKFDAFTSDTYTKSDAYLKRGDILVKSGHTAVVLSNGSKVTVTTTPAAGSGYVQVLGGSVNVRKTPKTGASLEVVKKGDKLSYLGTATTGWFHVKTPKGKTGYISNRSDLTKLHVSKRVQVLGAGVNVRTSGSTAGSIVGTAKKGQYYEYLGKASSGWYKINFGGKTGYISNKTDLTKLV